MGYETKILQQTGIVAGICNKIGLSETIDQLIQKPNRKVSVGKAVQAMILNALGFSNKALYLTPNFYKNRPVEYLVGAGINAEDLHDDCLGTALDALYDYGVTELFYQVSSQALSVFGIKHNFVHLDTTSFSLHGDYDNPQDKNDEKLIKITKGYSKDNNPDLNQVVLSLMCSYKSSIPVWLEVLSGNSSDKKSFKETIKQYKKQFSQKKLPYMIADSALYTKNGLSELSEVKWVTRVPETLKEAKKAIEETDKDEMIPAQEEGYRIKEVSSDYGGIKQRWLVVFSEKSYRKQYDTLTKRIRAECDKKNKEFWHLTKKSFACEADALKAAESFNKTMKYHRIDIKVEEKGRYEKKGRPDKETKPKGYDYFITGSLEIKPEAVGKASQYKGFFIIATNELSEQQISNEQLLSVYKAQGVSVERGFRFLKDPLFYAESLYLKSEKRIMALLMIMGISLLVYSLAEKELRLGLKKSKKSVSNQKGKPTSTPTLRWVFQMFDGIILLSIRDGTENKKIVMNMNDDHKNIIQALGAEVRKMYFLEI